MLDKIPYWEHGDLQALSEKTGISRNFISEIVHRRVSAGKKTAFILETFTGVPSIEWIFNKSSSHPAFYGKPTVSRDQDT
jgi:plasmid maintenance system antidote protein VapI